MTSLFIVLAMYLLLGWITAKGTLVLYYKDHYKNLLGNEQDTVCFCFWFWWLVLMFTFTYGLVSLWERYLGPVFSKLWNKIL